MTLVSSELGKKFEELRRGLESNESADSSSADRAEVRLIKDQRSEAKVRSFTLVMDEPESFWRAVMGNHSYGGSKGHDK